MEYASLASNESIQKTIAGLKERNVDGVVVDSAAEAMELIKTWIPKGASVQTGASQTLEQIGFIEYLKSGTHGWNNLKAAIAAEANPEKQADLRKQALTSDFYLGSVHAVAETGHYVVGSNTASQLPHVAYSSPNVIFVVSTKKITVTLADAIRRLEEHVVPLEDARMRKSTNNKFGTRLSKELIVHNESPFNKRNVRMIFVNEDLGF